jgi:hypothetical protein
MQLPIGMLELGGDLRGMECTHPCVVTVRDADGDVARKRSEQHYPVEHGSVFDDFLIRH